MKNPVALLFALVASAATHATTYTTDDFVNWETFTAGFGMSAEFSTVTGNGAPSFLVGVAAGANGFAAASPLWQRSDYPIAEGAFRLSVDVSRVTGSAPTAVEIGLGLYKYGEYLISIPVANVPLLSDWQTYSYSGVISAQDAKLVFGSWDGTVGAGYRFGLVVSSIPGSASAEFAFDNLSISVVPEPASAAMLAGGLLACFGVAHRRRRSN